MRYVMMLLTMLPVSAAAQGFYGGAADGMRERERIELQRRALELDRRYGTSTYRDYEAEQLREAIEENNRLLRQQRIERFIFR